MLVITVANVKGGVGKTTIATNLAVMAAACGSKVLLIDTDPQESALDWTQIREAENSITTIKPTGKVRETIKAMRSAFDLILIDVGGINSNTLIESLTAADFVLIPVEPGQFEYLSTKTFIQTLNTVATTATDLGKPFAARIVLNRVIQNTLIAGQFQTFLAEHGDLAPVLKTRLHNRMAYKYAAGCGQGAIEYEPGSEAAREMLDLWEEISNTINQM